MYCIFIVTTLSLPVTYTRDYFLVTTKMLLSIFLVFCAIGFLIYKYLTFYYNHWKKVGLFSPKPQFLYGNFPSIINAKQNFIYDVDDLYTKYKKEHHAIGVYMLRKPEILIFDPKLAHDILVTNFSKFKNNIALHWTGKKNYDKYATRNPFFAGGDEWKSLRGDALAGITINKLHQAEPLWRSTATKLETFLKQSTSTSAVELETKNLAYRFTIDIMCSFLWGLDSTAFTKFNEPNIIKENGTDMLKGTFEAINKVFQLNYLPDFLRNFYNHRFFPEKTDEFFCQLTKDAIEMRLKNKQGLYADYLNYVLQLQEKKHLSHDDIVGYILTVFLDGYETTATVIFHTLFFLAHNVTVQDKLRQEILENVADDDFITFETLNNLPYLEQCIMESIRIITPIPIIGRICTEPTEFVLENNHRLQVPEGTAVTIPTFSIHHDADYFPQPYKYKPERFDNRLQPELTKRGIFFPFGDGPRICLGMRTGLYEAKTCITQILKSFRVKCCPKTMKEKKPDSDSFILQLNGEIWLEYERLTS